MFIEHKGNTVYLTTKLYGYKHRVNFSTGSLSQESLLKLNDKFLTSLLKSPKYGTLADSLYSHTVLITVCKENIHYALLLQTSHSQIAVDAHIVSIRDHYTSYFQEQRLADFIYNSNKIEGSKTPYEQVALLLKSGNQDGMHAQDALEVLNMKAARAYCLQGFTFTARGVKKLLKIMTAGLLMENGLPYPQGFKRHANVVGNSPTTPPHEVSEAMRRLFVRYRKNKTVLDPYTLAFEFHNRFEKIHPFHDGNGRTGRLIMNKILVANRCAPCIIYNQKRTKYFNAFTKTEPQFIEFMMSQYEKTFTNIYPSNTAGAHASLA